MKTLADILNKTNNIKRDKNGKMKVVKFRDRLNKQADRKGLKRPTYAISMPCHFCNKPRAGFQVKAIVGNWRWICPDCIKRLK